MFLIVLGPHHGLASGGGGSSGYGCPCRRGGGAGHGEYWTCVHWLKLAGPAGGDGVPGGSHAGQHFGKNESHPAWVKALTREFWRYWRLWRVFVGRCRSDRGRFRIGVCQVRSRSEQHPAQCTRENQPRNLSVRRRLRPSQVSSRGTDISDSTDLRESDRSAVCAPISPRCEEWIAQFAELGAG